MVLEAGTWCCPRIETCMRSWARCLGDDIQWTYESVKAGLNLLTLGASQFLVVKIMVSNRVYMDFSCWVQLHIRKFLGKADNLLVNPDFSCISSSKTFTDYLFLLSNMHNY
ncbi:hypothetical protein ATANTOWER_013168 [Ataeniobius toweri]|uniref:Uncharacterized protein n=1 Tax=Ataeniobius toweri TaxID=208326 RepID=A0ABU7C3F9_9TELE|nr:hypothetical protein [Ataeniobius toweri]